MKCRRRSRRTSAFVYCVCADTLRRIDHEIYSSCYSFAEKGLWVLSTFLSSLLHLRATAGGDWPVQEASVCITELCNQRGAATL